MTCHVTNREEQAERYLAGRLPEDESTEFELHFFSCSPCLSAVRSAEALADALTETRVAPTRRAGNRTRLAVAAAVVAGLSLVELRSQRRIETIPDETAPPTPVAPHPYAALAAFEPPPAPSVTLRSAGLPDLDRGLDLYRQGDFGGAIRALEASARTLPDAAAPFFLGVSLLQVGETERAITALSAAVARGDSPYLEEAHLYLARAHFAKGDFRAAERELEVTLALNGDRGDEARGLLERSRSLRPRQAR